ncbi:glycosyltransferase family 1 protein [Actinotalea sp. C106]|uniref:glycosyltransferase family 4 protein n=1 Tax=Actinotalea sp. C106 TaxID=2908644 RepID=UPI0020279013|nr:glycosyltransferase family 1 protein [Actinotalea sp. C106]
MTPSPHDREALLGALDQRLGEAARVAFEHVELDVETHGIPGARAAYLLPPLVAACAAPDRADLRWLLLTAATGAFPRLDEVRSFGRLVEVAPLHDVESWVLGRALDEPHRANAELHLEIVEDGVLVDVDHCARYDTHTGIHRVVRETVPRWASAHGVTASAWTDQASALRTLSPRESARVFQHGEPWRADPDAESGFVPNLVVPWRSVVVLPDVPKPGFSDQLAALGASSGNTLSIIGYDMIPITSADTRPARDTLAFAEYLTVVKYAHRVAGISRSATAEFAGFASAVRAQGLRGPRVTEVLLTEDAPPAAPQGQGRTARARPSVLCIGSREPHKNQRAVLHAAELLWRDGLDFDVRLVGGQGWSDEVLRPVVDRLLAAGRPVHDIGRVSEKRLWEELRGADFTVFVSLHEGYGLPVSESLACGTPVITSNFGSQQEIAERGGCVTVDPRSDHDIAAAMRRLLTEPAELDRLRSAAAGRASRTWDTYAEELWDALIAPADIDEPDESSSTADALEATWL